MQREALVVVGGAQGSGIETSAIILASALARQGYGVLSSREYYSNIVGRHSYIHLKVSATEIPRSLSYPVNVVAGLDAESVFAHFDDLAEGGFLVYDTGVSKARLAQIASMEPETRAAVSVKLKSLGAGDTVESLVSTLESMFKVEPVGLSFNSILDVLAHKTGMSKSEVQRFRNSIIVGAIAGLMDIDQGALSYSVDRRFGKRPKLAEVNKALIFGVMDDVKGSYGTPLKLENPKLGLEELLLVSGNDMVAMGKIVGGLRYQAYYPITPATDESTFHETFESLKVDGESLGSIIVMQTEDEIAAVNSAIGAALAGVRASTSTSGPGFSLMVEGLGWAGMNEVPIVITYYQRGGPSTGMPTRGSQSDLLFTLFASHGEFPRVVVTSGDHLEAFYDSIWAFNVAEKYQVPVIHLIDKFLANITVTTPLPSLSRVRIERGQTILEVNSKSSAWKRFDKSDTISPRPVLGSGAVTWYTGDEHNEWGHITEDPRNRLEMYEKRWRKMELMDSEIPEEERAVLHGDGDFLLIGWGSVKGPALDALRRLESRGYRGALLQLRVFSPFPSRFVSRVLSGFDPERVIDVENNIMGQAALSVAMNTGFKVRKYILKWTGRPIYEMELASGIMEILEGGKSRVVLSYGK
ncbi:MAG: 2-oxoacid:ferredoxin oxidoreductase subunit alpha [Thermoprotei archaeon]|nr:2-oxoacid:ferredoxin oxidoreductase subunit alpha [Thermoprotei archaeon]